MTDDRTSRGFTDLIKIEDDVVGILDSMSYELEHLDCFDREQRAEIHTILRAIQADTRKHREIVSSLSGEENGEYIKNA